MGYDEYYLKQAGNGMIGYSGVRYQKGNGFFGRLMSGAFLPWIKKSLKFLGKNALNAGVNIGSDLLKSDNFSKENIKEVSKKHAKDQGLKMADEVMQKVLSQTGKGRRRRRKAAPKKTKRKHKARKTNATKVIKGRPLKKKKRKSKKKSHTTSKLSAKDFLSV